MPLNLEEVFDPGEILKARHRISSLVYRTPLIHSHALSERTGNQIYLKMECWQRCGCFKVRGALNATSSLTQEERSRGLVTASSGNHALAIAYAANLFSIRPTRIYVPENADPAKVRRALFWGPDLVYHGQGFQEAYEESMQYTRENNMTFIHSHADPKVIAGQGTIGLEIIEDLPEADAVIEDEFETSQVEHCCLETQGCLARYDRTGRLTVWTSIQMPFLLRKHLAECLGLPEGRVRIIRTALGGGFGKRMEMHDFHPICALLAMETGRPVRLILSRAEDFVGSRTRHPMGIRLRTGATRDGRILGQEMEIVTDNGAYMSAAPGVTFTAANYNITAYSKVEHYRFDGRIVYTNKNYGGSYRGYGNPQGTFAREIHMDVLAEKLGLDPVAIRLKNVTESGDVSACGYRITSCGMRECIEKAAGALDWAGKKKDRTFGRGIGIACAVHCGGGVRVYRNTDLCGVIAKMEDDGTVQVLTGATEIGSGQDSVIAAVVAEEVGLSPEDVQVHSEDTDVVPWDLGAHGSRTTFIAGNAARRAAIELKDQLLQEAAEILEADAADLAVGEGEIFVRGSPQRRVGIADIARSGHYRKNGRLFMGRGVYDPPHETVDKETHSGNISAAYSFCAQVAEVEVDPDTGQVSVLGLAAAHDVGFPICPPGVEGQIEGGVMQGVGYALMEEMIFDSASGQLVNGALDDYKLPTTLDMPPVHAIVVSSNDEEGPFGAKGFAETTVTPTAAAIANAVYDAVGVRIRTLPLTPEKIFTALQAWNKD